MREHAAARVTAHSRGLQTLARGCSRSFLINTRKIFPRRSKHLDHEVFRLSPLTAVAPGKDAAAGLTNP